MPNLQVGSSLSASGQWVTDGTNNSALSLTNDTTDRVGIGIQNPGALLHVSGVDKELKFTDTAGVAKDLTIRIGNNSLGTGNPGLELDTTVVSGNAMGYLLLIGGSPVAAIDKNGKIGIGTTEPSELLHIKGTGSAEIKLESNSGSAYIRQSNNTLNFFNVAERLTILNNGNVGIGTASPAHKLELKTTETEDGIYAYYGANNYKAYSLACAEGMGNFASNLEMFPPTNGFANPLVKLQAHNTGGGTISLKNSDGTTTVNIASDGDSYFNGGKVGIGTMSPNQKLQVNGNISVGPDSGSGTYQVLRQLAVTHQANDVPNSTQFGMKDAPGGTFAGMSVDGIRDLNVNDYSLSFHTHHGLYSAGPRMTIDKGGSVGIGVTNPATKLELAESKSIAGATSDGYSAGLTLDPEYSAASAQTVTRHNYIDLNNPGVTNVTITNAAVMRFDAAAGTHKAVDSGTTKTSPGTVNAWLKVNINGTIYYIPAYTSKTA